MLNQFLWTKIEEKDIGNIWFQQDSAKCHTTEATIDVLRPVFENRIISRRADAVWPARSCNLTPLDYYLWGAVKDKFYADKLETIDALNDNIQEEDIGNIWFQQNITTFHIAEGTLGVLHTDFEDRIISRRADVVRPPRCYDLTPLDYYLWGAVKDKCYADKPEKIEDLKDNVHEAIGEI